VRVVIVTVNYNRPGETVELINSIKHSDLALSELLVVDNGSTDNSPAILKKAFPDLRILQTGQNLGFAGGYNFGMRQALEREAAGVLIINNDTIVPSVFLEPLVTTLESNTQIGAVAPKIYFRDGKRVWWAGGRLNLGTGQILNIGSGQIDLGQFESPLDCDYLTGAGVLFRGEALKKVGLFDERFRHTGEDVDLSIRFCKAGYRLLLVPQATLIHKVSQTAGGEFSPFHLYNLERARIMLIRRWGYWVGLITWFKLVPLMTCRFGSVLFHKGRRKELWSLVKGWYDGAYVASI